MLRALTPARRWLPAVVLGLALAVPGVAQAAKPPYYVSLGDSYAVGFQRKSLTSGSATRHGYANQLLRPARKRGWPLRLVNFGCGGATTTSILQSRQACPVPAIGGPGYKGRTQAAAAARFLRRHRGAVDLITVSIGGNDVTACAAAPDPVACVAGAVKNLERNVRRLVRRLRAAAGRKVRIVGLTYPDVILGMWVPGPGGEPPNQNLATLSVVAFRSLINPALKKAYRSVRGRFVDVTAATGAYTPLTETTTLAPYGVVPKAVAEVCRLTYFCQYRDIHARTSGYGKIAELIAKTLPRRRG